MSDLHNIAVSAGKSFLDGAGNQAGKVAVDLASSKLQKKPGTQAAAARRDEAKERDFVFIVNNLSGYDLHRVNSAGKSGAWPIGDIEKDKRIEVTITCKSISLAAQYTAIEAKPGVHGIALAAAFSDNQELMITAINLFPGKNADYAIKHLKKDVREVEENGNRALLLEKKGGFVFEFEIKTLGYEQVAVRSSQPNASRRVVDLLKSETGKLPQFTFVVNNQSGYDLRPVRSPGSWPLAGHDIRDGECVAGGVDYSSMSFAVQYTACDNRTGIVEETSLKKFTVALAGDWPALGGRKIIILEGRGAKYAHDNMKACSDYTSAGENRAFILEMEGKLIYSFDITNVEYNKAPVVAGEGAPKKAVDLLFAELGRRPGFVFVVNNNTNYDLKRTGSAGTAGGWPLGDVKKNECIAGSLDRTNMSLAVEYSTESGEKISLAGSWPWVGRRKIAICKGMSAKQAYMALSGVSTHNDGSGNQAEITTENGSCIYSYSINSV